MYILSRNNNTFLHAHKKISTSQPAARKNYPLSPSDFRPISILSSLSKVFALLMAKQMNEFVKKHNFISPLQSGDRKNHSCSNAALKITDDIRSIKCELLSCKLKAYYGLSISGLRLEKSYLVYKFRRVKIGDDRTSIRSLQGCFRLHPWSIAIYHLDKDLSLKLVYKIRNLGYDTKSQLSVKSM